MVRPDRFPSDEEFYEFAQNQPDRALETIVKFLGGPLLGHLTKRLASRQEAEDCIQELLIRVANDLPSYNKSGSAAGWVFLRANWTVLKMRQRAAREKEPGAVGESGAGVSRMSEESMRASAELAMGFLSTLSEPKRELFEKRFVLGWTHEEIAAECGAHADAVRKASSRLLAEFRRTLERHGLWP